jgi:hypothetical protein
MASFCARRNERRTLKTPDSFGPVRRACDGSPMTVRGGGSRRSSMALMPKGRMGPPLRSFAADAHGCIMVRVFGPAGYKVAARFACARKRLHL